MPADAYEGRGTDTARAHHLPPPPRRRRSQHQVRELIPGEPTSPAHLDFDGSSACPRPCPMNLQRRRARIPPDVPAGRRPAEMPGSRIISPRWPSTPSPVQVRLRGPPVIAGLLPATDCYGLVGRPPGGFMSARLLPKQPDGFSGLRRKRTTLLVPLYQATMHKRATRSPSPTRPAIFHEASRDEQCLAREVLAADTCPPEAALTH